jgi:hypothetical protein
MTHPVYEGTWEEVSRHANELAGRRVRLTILDEPETLQSNDAMLMVLERIAERNRHKPLTPGEDTQKLLREARSGKMFDYDSNE